MGERYIRVNGTNEVNIEVNGTGDTTIFLPAEGGTLALQSAIPGGIAAGTQTGSTGTIVFSNSNGVTFGMNNSSIVTASVSSLVFSNSNNVSFGVNGSTLTATVTVAQSNQNISLFALGNTTQNSSTVLNASNLSFNGIGAASIGYSNGSIQFSVPTQTVDTNKAGTGATTAGNNIGLSATLNTNGLSLSATVPAQTNQNISLYGLGNTTQNSSTVLNASNLSFNAIGSLTVGYSNGSIQLSAPNALTSQSNQAFSAGAASSAFQTLIFQDSNGVSFSNNAGSLRVAHELQFTSATSAITSNALNTSASRVINIVAATNNTGGGTASLSSNVSFSNANNFTFYTSAGGAIVGSFSQSVDTVKAGTGATTAGNNIGLSATLNTNGLSLSATVAAQTNQSVGLYGLGNTTQNSSTTLDARSLSFNAIGSLTVGYSNGSIQLSAPNALTSQSNQAFSAGAASSAFQTLIFQDSNGVSFSNNAGSLRVSHDLQFTSATSAITSNALNTSASRVINIVAATNNTGGGTASLSSNVSFSNANNFTFYTSAGGAIVGSFSQSVDTVKAGTGVTTAGNNVGLSATLNTNGLSISATAAAQTNQSIGLYGLGNTTQNSSTTLDARSLSFNAIGSLTVGYSNGSIQLSAPNALTSQSNQAFSAEGGSSAFQTLVFTNSNGISFSNTNGSVWASHNGITTQTNQNISLYALGNTTQNSSTVLNASNLSFNGIGNASVGFSNGSIQISVTAAGGAGITAVNVSAGTESNNVTNFQFNDGNGVSFGLDGSTVTASHNGLTSQSNQAFSAGAASSAFQTLVFQDSNGVSFSNNAGSLRVTHDLQFTSATSAITSNALNTSASRIINIIAATNNTGGGTASLSSNVSFSNANNFTFYTSAGNAIVGSFSQSIDTVKAGTGVTTAGNNVGLSATLNTNGLSISATAAAQSNQNISLFALGNTTQNSSTVLNASNLSFNAIGSLTVGYSNGSIQLSAPNALTSQSNQAFSAGAASSAFQTLIFQDSNGVSFSNNAGSLRVSHDLQFTSATSAITSNALNTSASRVINIIAATNNTGGGTASLSSNVSFSNANNFTFYTSAGGAIVGSFSALTTARASTDAVGLNTAQTNVTWTVNSSGISINASGYAGTNTTFNGANISGSITQNSAGLNLSLSVAAPGAAAENNWVNLLGANTAGNTTASGSTIGWSGGNNITLSGANGSQVVISGLSFANSNGITFGTNAGTLTASHNGFQNWELEGANTAGTTGSAQGSVLYLSGGDNITLSGNSNTIIISAAAGGGGFTANSYQNRQLGASTNTVAGQNSVWLIPMRLANAVNAVTGLQMVSLTGSVTSNQTNTVGYTLRAGIYKVTGTNGSRLDSIFTTSFGFTFWNSGTASVSYSYNVTSGSSAGSNLMTASVYGLRQITWSINSTFDTGLYAYGFVLISSSAGNSSVLRSFNPVIDNPLPIAMGFMGSATNASIGYVDGGTFSVTSASMPVSFLLADIRQTLNAVPYFKMGAI